MTVHATPSSPAPNGYYECRVAQQGKPGGPAMSFMSRDAEREWRMNVVSPDFTVTVCVPLPNKRPLPPRTVRP